MGWWSWLFKPWPKPPKPPLPPIPPTPLPPIETRINCTVTGTATDIPALVIDTGGRYAGVFESTSRVIFTVPENEPAPYGSTFHYGGQTLRYLYPASGGDHEGPLLAYAPAIPSPIPFHSAGRYLLSAGSRIKTRGITAFPLASFINQGHPEQARDYLRWAASHRLMPRVLCMAEHLFHLSPEDGRNALGALVTMARDEGCLLNLCALADTGSYPGMDMERHLREVGAYAAIYHNARVSVGNEVFPVHPTQDNRLDDVDFLIRLAKQVPSSVPVSLGSSHGNDEDRTLAHATVQFPNGTLDVHTSRTDEEDGWKWVRHVNELGWMADDTRLYADNEEPKRNDVRTDRHLALGVMTHGIRNIGDTFHYLGGLYGTIPAGLELDAFLARERGWNLVPTTFNGAYRNAGQAGSPVKSFQNANRVYSAIDGPRALVLGVDAANASVQWSDHWSPGEPIAAEGGAKVWWAQYM